MNLTRREHKIVRAAQRGRRLSRGWELVSYACFAGVFAVGVGAIVFLIRELIAGHWEDRFLLILCCFCVMVIEFTAQLLAHYVFRRDALSLIRKLTQDKSVRDFS